MKIAALFLWMLLVSCVSPPPPAVPVQEPGGGTLEVAAGTLHYEVAGAGVAVVLIHGGFGDRRMWDDQFQLFASEFRVIRYDLRGYGKSSFPRAPYSPADDLLRLLDHLKIDRAHVVGNSMGGSFALDFTLLHPSRVQSLVMVASGPNGYPATPEDVAKYQSEMDATSLVFKTARVEGAARGVELWAADPMVAVASKHPTAGPRLRQMIRENARMFELEHWPDEPMKPAAVERLGEVKVPTLILFGDKDTPLVQAAAEVAARGIPGAKRTVITGADHLPQMEMGDEVNGALRAFWQR